jgi:hypothetical protein
VRILFVILSACRPSILTLIPVLIQLSAGKTDGIFP